MAQIETWFEQDLKKPVAVHKLDSVFSQDAKGNLIGVKVFNDGVAVALTDSITGYCVLADGSTVPVSGSRSGNQASIVLPASAYNVLGPIMITVKNTGSDYATTLCAVAGLVVRSRTGSQVDPGSVVTDWTNQISAQLQAVQTAADNLGSVLAVPFSNLTAYSAGNYVMKDGNLYCFTTDHAAGDWNSSQVRSAKLADDVHDLKSTLDNVVGDMVFDGSHTYSGGAENWATAPASEGQFAVKIYSNTAGITYEIAVKYGGSWHQIATINDASWHLIDLPSNVTDNILITYRGSASITTSATVVKCDTTSVISDIIGIKGDIADVEGDIESIEGEIDGIDNKIDALDRQQVKTIVTYPHSGYITTDGTVEPNPEWNYSDYILAQDLDADVNIFWHQSVATFTFYDANKTYLNEYIKRETIGHGMEEKTIAIPSDAVYVIVCTETQYDNKVYYYNTKELLLDTSEIVLGTKEAYGNNGETETSYSFDLNFSACPCKKATKGGKVTSLYIKNYSSGTVDIYVGEVDQLYLFVPRASYTINVSEGANIYDVTEQDIFINEGEQLLIRFSGGKTAFASITGEPEGDNSFYYNNVGGMQLQVFGAQKAARFGFGYTIASSIIQEQGAQIAADENSIATLTENVSVLQANFNIVSDRQGNKYRMYVQNGAIALLAMNFAHVLCVGNSYTTHPTTTDTETDYRNNLWWGHWSMAATAKQTAWTTLLQNALRQKINNAVVTPIFGRRYETAPNTYTLTNPNTFTYWDGTAWQSLKDNLASFSDVDAIVFFLGANYSGNDWYTLYSNMVQQFLTWFPNTVLFCCSCSYFDSGAKDTAIQQVASEQMATYISMVGINGKNKLGAYVYGDDNTLHQIDNSAVAGHFGDYGEYVITDRIVSAMGYQNNTTLYNITMTSPSGVTFSAASTKAMSGAVVSIFAEVASGTTLSSITVKDGNNNVTVTDHGVTSAGRVFTFIMPSSDVTITGVTA